jgi:hypothetical protein
MESNNEMLTIVNGEKFIFPKVSVMENGELKFEIEKEEPIVETLPNKPKKDCIKYISTCTST